MSEQPHLDDGIAEAQQLVEENETGGRILRGFNRWLVFSLAVSWSVFQLGLTSAFVLDAARARAIHLTFALALGFLLFPLRRTRDSARIPWYDYLIAAIGITGTLYLVVEYAGLQERTGIPLAREVWLGAIFILVLLEATRRTVGPSLAIIAGLFIVYSLTGPRGTIPINLPELIAHRGYPIDRLISQMYVTSEGIFGVALGVSTNFVFLFVLFGSMLDKAGAGRFFVDVANSFLGGLRGGPAKAAVVASGLTGTISGSSLANVVSTGTFTIPLMVRAGYPAIKAAAIEVAVSTNGQLMPPVMGAAAFIIAEFTDQSYPNVLKAAVVPAVISYLALFYIVHLEALKLGLRGLPREAIPPRRRTIVLGSHNLIPIVVLVWGLAVARVSPSLAVTYAIASLPALALIKSVVAAVKRQKPIATSLKESAFTIVDGLEAGAKNMVGIAIAVSTAGIVVGAVNLTGLGLRLTEIVESIAAWLASGIGTILFPILDALGGNSEAFGNGLQFTFVLLATAIASLILGLGLPTTANYIVVATLTAPVIYTLGTQFGYDIPLIAVHLFVFFFGILADDTPPVGLAAYAAAAIARSNPVRTGVQGFTYDLRTAILPFIFIFNPKLLLLDLSSWYEGLWVIFTATAGMYAFSTGTMGYVIRHANVLERCLLIGSALLLLHTGLVTDVLGLLITSLIYLRQLRMRGARNAIESDTAPDPTTDSDVE
ncbi:TRAP transporter, 4TM/12TM fusion protein [Rubidibacter lacunae KORDI 51-2]|uniref:TRAP transporter, 4TM/12TM fusion protein n=1 Tax=Rubidibacter lacunae KORDI 51-2 TaxID=582515 RepID=U5DNZ4_9CHRO|nr:TRAP transporter permease [Rubidibacter lacunae]ERN42572.1 TRAP transporter, 4TM/12TM fusion protein [Rubidibacter lacunae KORDI 51-2]